MSQQEEKDLSAETEAEGIARIKAEMLADPDDYARRVWYASKIYRSPSFLRSTLAAAEQERTGSNKVLSLEEFDALMATMGTPDGERAGEGQGKLQG